MALKIQNTNTLDNFKVSILVYGFAGSGKTRLCTTLNKPFIISCEKGLGSIKGSGIPYFEVSSEKEVFEALSRLANAPNGMFETIVLDSISELSEIILAEQKMGGKNPHGAAAYGYMQDKIKNIIRFVKNMNCNFYATCKMTKEPDEDGVMLYSPFLPSKNLSSDIPYHFEEVLALRVKKEKDEDGVEYNIPYLQTMSDGKYQAKDRLGNLGMYEPYNLQNIIDKCLWVHEDKTEVEVKEDAVQPEIQDMEQERPADDIPEQSGEV